MYSPTAHLLELDCGKGHRIGRLEWHVWVCMSWGLPNQQAITANLICKKCKCGTVYNKNWHYVQNC